MPKRENKKTRTICKGPRRYKKQLFTKSRLSKCFNFENVLSEWECSKYFYKKKLEDYLNHSCWVFKWDKQANNNYTTANVSGKLGRADGTLFPSLQWHLHLVGLFRNGGQVLASCDDLSYWVTERGSEVQCLGLKVLWVCQSWCWAWGIPDNKARLIPWKGVLGPHTECSMGAHWENPRPRFQAVRGELCTLTELKPGGSVCALSNDCVLSSSYSSTIGYWKGQSPACLWIPIKSL